MKGVQYIVDNDGEKKAAVIDLKIYSDVWEDIHDILMVKSRKNEPRLKWADVREKNGR